MKGYKWTFLQKNVDFGDCGRRVWVCRRYLLPLVTMTTRRALCAQDACEDMMYSCSHCMRGVIVF